MKEQLISLEVAILAQIKGFDEKVNTYYDHYGLHKLKNGKLFNMQYNDNVSAPTQGLLQKWLREIHKIDIYILGYGFVYYAQLNNVPPANQENVKYIDRRWNMPPQDKNSGNLNTYEDALEVALQEALKLTNETTN